MQEILKVYERPKATLHSFRRTFNNALRDLGLQIQDRQALLAHASAETTKVYTNPNLELARRYVNQIPKMQNVTKT
jgi:integrase